MANNLDLINHIQNADLIINTTPIGMSKGEQTKRSGPLNEMPFGQEIWANLSSKTVLYDLIYVPKPTPWLQFGAKHGCVTIDGLEMLVQQGAASLRLWSGQKEVPINTMREAAEQVLTL